jgi:hypothetical protein
MRRIGSYMFVLFTILLSLGAEAKISKEHQAACKAAKSEVADAYCDLLDDEFGKAMFANGSYPQNGVLLNPMSQEIPFTAAIFHEAYLHVLSSKLTADAKSLATSALQTEANQLGQALSTKAAVPQTGANANTNGSTNLVSKPTTTDLISLAAESGAFTDTVNGTTMTAQANANGLRRYLAGDNFANLKPTALDTLQHLTLTATFNVAQGGTTSATTTGQATSTTPTSITSVVLPSQNLSFSSIGASLAVYRPYTPTSTGFGKAWTAAIVKNQDAITKTSKQLFVDYQKAIPNQGSVFEGPEVKAALDTWNQKAGDDEKANDFHKFVSDFITFVNTILAELETDPSFYQNILSAAADTAQLQQVRNTILDTARGSLATFKYTYSTPPGKPATHDATAVIGYVWGKGDEGAQLTFNASGSWFSSIPAGAKYGRVKDYQISGEFDQPIGADRSSPRAIFSVAGYGQYQYSANVLNVTVANVVPGTNISVPSNSQVFTSTPGWLGVAQTKLVFNIGKGTSIPIAVKWSNKTDLLTGSDWKGQFGISYDLSALSSILQAK